MISSGWFKSRHRFVAWLLLDILLDQLSPFDISVSPVFRAGGERRRRADCGHRHLASGERTRNTPSDPI
jgi:hypothetical protein